MQRFFGPSAWTAATFAVALAAIPLTAAAAPSADIDSGGAGTALVSVEGVPLTPPSIGDGYGAVSLAQAEVDAAQASLRLMSAAVNAAEIVLADATAAATEARINVDAAQRDVDDAQLLSGATADDLVTVRNQVDDVAAAAFLTGSLRPSDFDVVLASDGPTEATAQQAFLAAVGDDQVEQILEQRQLRSTADDQLLLVVDRMAARQGLKRQADINVDIATSNRDAADQALALAADRLTAATENLSASRTQLLALAPTATLESVDIPVIAVDAYVRSAAWARQEFVGCGIQWYVIAGIARQESNHGRIFGSSISAGGDVVPNIVGIALDGTRSLAITDTDGGLLDGDPVWDRAIGPTQFIPETWRSYALRFDLDGNSDGREDPHNIYDQTRATATLLCRNGWNEFDDAAARGAVYSYNPSNDYVIKVMNWISGYRAVTLPDINLISTVGSIAVVPPAPPPLPPTTVASTIPVSDDPAGTSDTGIDSAGVTPATTAPLDPPARPSTDVLPSTTSTVAPSDVPTTTMPATTLPAATVPTATTTTTMPAATTTTTVPAATPTTTTAPDTTVETPSPTVLLPAPGSDAAQSNDLP